MSETSDVRTRRNGIPKLAQPLGDLAQRQGAKLGYSTLPTDNVDLIERGVALAIPGTWWHNTGSAGYASLVPLKGKHAKRSYRCVHTL